ncbi:hypothetical protein [Actinomadura gamaensis]|uniref:Uncharacterized protein n=1 Tax=Actinomadura gamaensis TaxID=1763541 RepID=A0ABV9UAV9_9ACTN
MKFDWTPEPDEDADNASDDIGLTNPDGLAQALSAETARMGEALALLTEEIQRSPATPARFEPDAFRPVKFRSRPSALPPADT